MCLHNWLWAIWFFFAGTSVAQVAQLESEIFQNNSTIPAHLHRRILPLPERKNPNTQDYSLFDIQDQSRWPQNELDNRLQVIWPWARNMFTFGWEGTGGDCTWYLPVVLELLEDAEGVASTLTDVIKLYETDRNIRWLFRVWLGIYPQLKPGTEDSWEPAQDRLTQEAWNNINGRATRLEDFFNWQGGVYTGRFRQDSTHKPSIFCDPDFVESVRLDDEVRSGPMGVSRVFVQENEETPPRIATVEEVFLTSRTIGRVTRHLDFYWIPAFASYDVLQNDKNLKRQDLTCPEGQWGMSNSAAVTAEVDPNGYWQQQRTVTAAAFNQAPYWLLICPDAFPSRFRPSDRPQTFGKIASSYDIYRRLDPEALDVAWLPWGEPFYSWILLLTRDRLPLSTKCRLVTECLEYAAKHNPSMVVQSLQNNVLFAAAAFLYMQNPDYPDGSEVDAKLMGVRADQIGTDPSIRGPGGN